jgi:hypothetical protein
MFDWWNLRRNVSGYCMKCVSALRRQGHKPRLASSLASREQLEQMDSLSSLLKQLPAPPMPPELAFRIRHRISQEQARTQRPSWAWRWRNEAAPFALPAVAGLFLAVLIFGTFIRIFEIPVQANSQPNQGDVPIGLRTPPQLAGSGPVESDSGLECMVVEILIDQNGRVADFHVIQGKHTPEQMRRLRNALVFAVFRPATVFGQPTSDTVFWFLPCAHNI